MNYYETVDELLNAHNYPIEHDIGKLHPSYVRFQDLTFDIEQLYRFAEKGHITQEKARQLCSALIDGFLKYERSKLKD
jgi:hypothetical protein